MGYASIEFFEERLVSLQVSSDGLSKYRFRLGSNGISNGISDWRGK